MHKSKAGRPILSILLAFSMVMVSLAVGVSPTVAASDAVLAGGDSIDVVNSVNVADKAKRAVSPLSDDDPIDVLEDMLDKARGVDRSLYTSASVGRLDAAILASQPIIDDPAGYTDDAIYAAAGALWNAYNELVYKANKAALEVVIEVAQGIDLNRLISSVRENLIVALAAAESAYADDNATQAQVDEAMEALIGAISEADFEKGSETRLRALVVSVQNTAAAGYTPASFAVFSAALANARAILDNAGDYTQRAFDEAYDALYAAHRGLVEATQTGPGPGTQNPGGKTTPGGVQPQAKVTAIRTPLKTLYIKKGKTLTPPVAFDGIGANGKAWGYGARSKLSWRVSSGKKVVSVNAKTGKIKAKKKGKAKVTATAPSGKKITFTIRVVAKAKKLSKISFKKPPKTVYLRNGKIVTKKGKTVILKIKPVSAKATGLKAKFKSSKKSVLKIDKAGKLYAGGKKGKVKITVRAGGKKKVIAIRVR